LAYFDTSIFGAPLDANTAPGYFSILLGVINIIVVFIYMKDFSTAPAAKTSIMINDPPKRGGIIIGLILFFFVISTFSVLLSTTTVFLDVNHGWEATDTAWIFVAGSVLGMCAFACVKKLNTVWSERNINLLGSFVAALALMSMGGFGTSGSAVPLGQWISSAIVFFFAHPFAMATVMSIYSKIVGPFKGDQGPYMGYITMVGSLASIVSPLWATSVIRAEDYSGNFTYFFCGLLLCCNMAFVLLCWAHLVPHPSEALEKTVEVAKVNDYHTFNEAEPERTEI